MSSTPSPASLRPKKGGGRGAHLIPGEEGERQLIPLNPPSPWTRFLAVRALVCCRPRLPSPSGHCQCVPALPICAGYVVTLVRICSPLFHHPAPCPRGYFSWLSALVTPPVALPRRQSSSAPCPRHSTGPWYLICMVSSLTPSLTTSSLSRRTPYTPFILPPSAFRLWGLAHRDHLLHRPSLQAQAGSFHLPLLP